jgi:hypothetical protein
MALTELQQQVLQEIRDKRGTSQEYTLSQRARIILEDTTLFVDEEEVERWRKHWASKAKELASAGNDKEKLRKVIREILSQESSTGASFSCGDDFCCGCDEEGEDGEIDIQALAMKVYDLLRFELRIERERLGRYSYI